MVAKNLLEDVLSLPVEDRVELFERLRESLEEASEAGALPEEHARELDRRYAEYLANPKEGYTLDEVKAFFEARRTKA